MKDIWKKIGFVVLSFVIFATMAFQVSAATPDGFTCIHNYHTFDDHKMNYGIGNYGSNRRYYWIANFDTTHANYIRNAVSEWVNTSPGGPNVSTSISLRETSTQSAAMFEFHDGWIDDDVLGLTHFFTYSTEIQPSSRGTIESDYGWVSIEISTSTMALDQIPAAQRQATMAHELGHGFGLSHQSYDVTSIMHQFNAIHLDGNLYFRSATRASANDCYAINHIYG